MVKRADCPPSPLPWRLRTDLPLHERLADAAEQYEKLAAIMPQDEFVAMAMMLREASIVVGEHEKC